MRRYRRAPHARDDNFHQFALPTVTEFPVNATLVDDCAQLLIVRNDAQLDDGGMGRMLRRRKKFQA